MKFSVDINSDNLIFSKACDYKFNPGILFNSDMEK